MIDHRKHSNTLLTFTTLLLAPLAALLEAGDPLIRLDTSDLVLALGASTFV